ncbi:MAG: AgrD family cyclic lactone autoinducer peptide [Acetivibrionales bacterium]|jgi:cyclic lactone autoinducer peptide
MIGIIGALLGKAVAALAFATAFLSNFTSCVVVLNQPKVPEKVRMLKK